MSRDQKNKALRQRAKSEANSKKPIPGSVMVKFKKPVNRVPWWRRVRDVDLTLVWSNSTAGSQGEVIVVQTMTPAGIVTRILNWDDVFSVVIVPNFETAPKEKPKTGPTVVAITPSEKL